MGIQKLKAYPMSLLTFELFGLLGWKEKCFGKFTSNTVRWENGTQALQREKIRLMSVWIWVREPFRLISSRGMQARDEHIKKQNRKRLPRLRLVTEKSYKCWKSFRHSRSRRRRRHVRLNGNDIVIVIAGHVPARVVKCAVVVIAGNICARLRLGERISGLLRWNHHRRMLRAFVPGIDSSTANVVVCVFLRIGPIVSGWFTVEVVHLRVLHDETLDLLTLILTLRLLQVDLVVVHVLMFPPRVVESQLIASAFALRVLMPTMLTTV